MPSVSRVIIAAAGGGKTTRIVREAIEESTRKVALVTYTLNNVKVIQDKLYLLAGAPPSHVEVFSWFSFLLRDLARPYRNALHDKRIEAFFSWRDGLPDMRNPAISKSTISLQGN